MKPSALLAIAIASLMATGFAATGAKCLRDFSRRRLELMCRRRRRRQLFHEIIAAHESFALGAQAFRNLMTVCFLVAGGYWAHAPDVSITPAVSELLSLIVAGALLLTAATVWIPSAIVQLWSANFLIRTWRAWKVVSVLMLPLTSGVTLVDALLRRLANKPKKQDETEEAFEEEIRTIVTAGTHEGLLEEDASEMIQGVIELGDTDVAQIMTPRSEVDALEVNQPWKEVLDFVIQVRRTRIPVYDRSLDKVEGILYVKDLLAELSGKREEPERPLRELLHQPWSVPRTKPVDDLLREFLDNRNHMAIVVDEYQAVAGVVTIEDALEEIVGEIVDEYDQEEEEDAVGDAAGLEVSARAHLDELNEEYGFDLPESDDFDTIGGLVIQQLGAIPKPLQSVQVGELLITVLEANRRRIERVRIEALVDQRESA